MAPPNGPRIAILVVGTIALIVFYMTWRYGTGWRWFSVVLTALFTSVAIATSVGEFPRWERGRRERFNIGMSVAALALLLAMAVVDAVASDPTTIDSVSIVCALGIPFAVFFVSFVIERRQASNDAPNHAPNRAGDEHHLPRDEQSSR